jgi:site-specific DNA recombinase
MTQRYQQKGGRLTPSPTLQVQVGSKPRVAIYARYSCDLSRDASIEDQVRLCRAYAARADLAVTKVFEDRAISGASAILRPGYQALLAEVQQEVFDVVLAESLDRITRDQEDVAALFKRLRFLGIDLVTVSEGEGEVNELHIGLKGAMNAIYLKDLGDKVCRGTEGRIHSGRSGGSRSYGYDVIYAEERGGRSRHCRLSRT